MLAVSKVSLFEMDMKQETDASGAAMWQLLPLQTQYMSSWNSARFMEAGRAVPVSCKVPTKYDQAFKFSHPVRLCSVLNLTDRDMFMNCI